MYLFNNLVARLAKIICFSGSSKVFRNGKYWSPDIKFTYAGAKYPSFVIQIVYSQSEKRSLPKLEEEYIVQNEGTILLVIGVEVIYRGKKMGIISTWCPKFSADDQGEYLASQQTIVS